MTTAAQLIQIVRENTDLNDTDKPSDSEVLTWINRAGAECHGIVASPHEDQLTAWTTVTVAAAQTSASLPSDFYRLRQVEKRDGSCFTALDPFTMLERSSLQSSLGCTSAPKYQLLGPAIFFMPTAAAPGTYDVAYVRAWVDMASTGSTLPAVYETQHWDQYIVERASMHAELAQGDRQSEAATYASLADQQKQRIIEEANWRDSTGRQKVPTRGFDPYSCVLDSVRRFR